MSTFISLDGVQGWIVLGTPILLFCVVAVWALCSLRRGRGQLKEKQGVSDDISGTAERREGQTGSRTEKGAALSLLGDAIAPTPGDARPVQDVAGLEKRIEGLKGDPESSQLAGLYRELAAHYRNRGEYDSASATLRESLGVAMRLNLKEEQARSRLEMGEVMADKGDLVAACEQWQIARELYAETNQKNESVAIDAKMRETGCPTDWVLNEF